MNKSKRTRHQKQTDAIRRCAYCLALVIPCLTHPIAMASESARNTWFSLGGEINRYAMGGFVTRTGVTFLNLNVTLAQRIHPDLWLGLNVSLGHDSDPVISRNHDQNIGISAYWFPMSLSSDSTVIHEGLQLSEKQTIRPFVVSGIAVGRALLRRVLNDFDASSDYLGVHVGVGAQYAVTSSFALSSSVNYQINFGLSQLPYNGQKIAITWAASLSR